MATYPESLLILNGKSAGNELLREVIAELRDNGVIIHVRVTWEKGDAARYIEEACQLGVETVIAGGGDGTINEIATALIERDAADRRNIFIIRTPKGAEFLDAFHHFIAGTARDDRHQHTRAERTA